MTIDEAKALYTPKSTYPMKMRFIERIYEDFKNEYFCVQHARCEYKNHSCNRWEQK